MIEGKDIAKLAELSRLTLSREEEQNFADDIRSILDYVGDIERAEVKRGDPELPQSYNTLRRDTDPHEGGIWSEKLLCAAPYSKDKRVKVKRIL